MRPAPPVIRTSFCGISPRIVGARRLARWPVGDLLDREVAVVQDEQTRLLRLVCVFRRWAPISSLLQRAPDGVATSRRGPDRAALGLVRMKPTWIDALEESLLLAIGMFSLITWLITLGLMGH